MKKILCSILPILFLVDCPGPARAAPEDASEDAFKADSGAHEILREILERPKYQRWRRAEDAALAEGEADGDQPSWIGEKLEEAGKWLGKKWDDLFGGSKGKSKGSSESGSLNLAGLLEIAAWAALGIVLAFIAVLVRRRWIRAGAVSGTADILSREQVKDALREGNALLLDSPQWLLEADRLLREGDFRAVYRALFLALLSGLHAAHKIDFQKNRTNWVYVRKFRGTETERGLFSTLTDLFDTVWYGLHQPKTVNIQSIKEQLGILIGQGVRNG